MAEYYPTGVQSFPELRKNEQIYVDKTHHIYNLVKKGASRVYFLSRPRRFGKSLLISTLNSLFQGKKELFEGLYIYDKVAWEKFPVIHISMSEIRFPNLGLYEALNIRLQECASEYDISLENKDLNGKFQELIKKLSAKYEKQVVILIDEYDKPITHGIEKDNADLAEENRDIMKNFYGGLKDLGEHIRFLFITGIAKFAKVSIFSELNHLSDITLEERFSTICGYTQQELEHYFPEGIDKLAIKEGVTREECLAKIKDWYNGFSWDGENFVYNPFSTLRLLDSCQFANHWFETGTPTFLVKILNERFDFAFDKTRALESDFSTFELHKLDPKAILLQTGYLTIKSKTKDNSRSIYFVDYPNWEVQTAFTEMLLGNYLDKRPSDSGLEISDVRDAFKQNDLNRVKAIITSMFASVPPQLFSKKNENGKVTPVGENFYHAVIYLIFNLLGTKMQAEVGVKEGRIDAVVETNTHIYLFEFKKNNSVDAAIEQIKEKEYAEKYRNSPKIVYLVGVSFSLRKKGLNAWKAVIWER
jgi:hypothetical protein